MLDYQRLIYPQMSARPWMNQSHLVMKFELASIRNRVSSNISKPFLNEERVLRVFGGSHSFFTGIPLGNGTCCSWVVGFFRQSYFNPSNNPKGLGKLSIFQGIREWLSFLFTCENQLMLGLLKEKHFQASSECIWLSVYGKVVKVMTWFWWWRWWWRWRWRPRWWSWGSHSCANRLSGPGHLWLSSLGRFHPGAGFSWHQLEAWTRSPGE